MCHDSLPLSVRLTLNLHAMPCTNACAHCWVQGSVRKPRMPFEQIAWVLGQLAGLKGQGIAPGFFLFDEPTHHPRFPDILQRAADLDLLPEGFFVATNGSILAIDRMRIGRRCGRPVYARCSSRCMGSKRRTMRSRAGRALSGTW